MIEELFNAIDSKDVNLFMSFLSPDCVFRFGNNPIVAGADDISKYIAFFFDSIGSLEHKIIDVFTAEGGLACHGTVSYTRLNGTTLTVPFANFFKINTTKIVEYLIFADTSKLYS